MITFQINSLNMPQPIKKNNKKKTLLANQIIHTGEFPRPLKIARVKPLFKKGDETSFSNYRPISMLPSI